MDVFLFYNVSFWSNKSEIVIMKKVTRKSGFLYKINNINQYKLGIQSFQHLKIKDWHKKFS